MGRRNLAPVVILQTIPNDQVIKRVETVAVKAMMDGSAFGYQRQTPMALMQSKITFWIRSDALLSIQPSTIQAMPATMKITNPRTVTRAFNFAATRAAAKTVVRAANVLNIIRTSMPSPITGRPTAAAT